MRKKLVFFKKSNVILWGRVYDIKESNSKVLTCNCEYQLCKGKYIKTRDYQFLCLPAYIKYLDMIKNQSYKIIKPNTEFPLYSEYEKYFKIDENVIFAFDNTIYTSNDLPDHLIEHEKTHLRQQNSIGCDNWVSLYLRDKDFRLAQEIEAYRIQLSHIKDKNARNKLKIRISEELSGEMYGNMVSKEEAINLLKE